MDASTKIFVVTRILVFDFELFIGGRCDLLCCSQLASSLESLFFCGRI